MWRGAAKYEWGDPQIAVHATIAATTRVAQGARGSRGGERVYGSRARARVRRFAARTAVRT